MMYKGQSRFGAENRWQLMEKDGEKETNGEATAIVQVLACPDILFPTHATRAWLH